MDYNNRITKRFSFYKFFSPWTKMKILDNEKSNNFQNQCQLEFNRFVRLELQIFLLDYTKGIKRLHNENLVNPERIHGNPWIKRSQRDGCVEDYFASLVKEKTKLPLEIQRAANDSTSSPCERNLQSDVEDPRARKQENPIGREPMTNPAVSLKGVSFCHPCQPVEQTRSSSIVDA